MNCYFNDEIPHDQFSNLKQIGSGSFSSIYSAIHIKTNSKVALKISLKNNNDENYKLIEHEIYINKMLHHPFICKFFTDIETEHLIIIVMELIEGITSLEYVNSKNGLSIIEARNIFVQLLVVIEYLHNDVHISHRDLKLENIMVDNYGHIRLIDFGFSSTSAMMSTRCGSIPYCAPEILNGDVYTNEADIWSMGIILYALIKGDLPFYHENMTTLADIICKQEITFPDIFSEELKDLLLKMLGKDPTQRIKIEEIKNHPFLLPEKLLQIDYKQIFSPSHLNQNHCPQISQINSNAHILSRSVDKFENITSSKFMRFQPSLLLSSNLMAQRRKSSFVRTSSIQFILPSQNQEVLRDKINIITEDVDVLIGNHKNYAFYLNSLIETAFRENSHQNNQEKGHENKNSFSKVQFPGLNAQVCRRSSHHQIYNLQKPMLQPIIAPQANKISFNSLYEEKNDSFKEEQ